MENNIGAIHITPPSDILKRKEPCSSAIHDTSHPASPSDPKHGGSSGKVEDQAADEDPYEYGYHIVEEMPTNSHDS